MQGRADRKTARTQTGELQLQGARALAQEADIPPSK